MTTRKVIGMPIDHNYHGTPVEYGFVRLSCSDQMSDEQVAVADRNQALRLKAMAKRMPHRYWMEEGKCNE